MLRLDELKNQMEELEKQFNAILDNDEEDINNIEGEIETLAEIIEIMEDAEITDIEKIVVSNIKWDTYDEDNYGDGDDDAAYDLPKKVVIDITMDNVHLLEDVTGYAETLSDYLSDEYGFCIVDGGFKVKIVAPKEN